MNHDAYTTVEHILDQHYGTDNVRSFQDISRPRDGKMLDMTIAYTPDQGESQLYQFTANNQFSTADHAIQPLTDSSRWTPGEENNGNAIDYQGITQALQDYGGWEGMPAEGFEGYFERLGASLSYENSDGWLLPTRDFHSMAGAVHHYGAGQDEETAQVERFDEISEDDFGVEDVVDFRDDVNDLKQEYGHELGDNERIVMDAAFEDGDYQLEAEVTEDWSFEDGYAESII